jgi:ribosomal protein S27AE
MTKDKRLKAEVMNELEQALEMMLKKSPSESDITLSEIEQSVGQILGCIQGKLMQELVDWSEEKPSEKRAECPECGSKMSNKGPQNKMIQTEHGGVEVRRTYQYCPTCQNGFFPPR